MNTSPTRDFLIELRPIPQRFNSRRKFQSLLLVAIWRGVGTLLLLGSAFGVTRAQIIQTVAGGASGGPSRSQNACVPIRAAAAHGTDIYVISCDQIYKVDAADNWTLVAGNGVIGFSGDGGPATNASLGEPQSITVDMAGNLYILDTLNGRVREVSAGVIQTIAGTDVRGFNGDGAAVGARISGRGGLAVDAQGNVFLADAGNGRIREIANGLIRTVAGRAGFGFSGDGGPATNAMLFNPMGVFVDASGNIFIADTSNQRIREVVGGIINTIAGNGTAGFAGDGGSATDAELNFPFGVFVDNQGNIFVADTENNRVREISAGTKKIQTLAGNGGGNPASCNTSFDQCIGDGGPAASAIIRLPRGVVEDDLGNLFIVCLVDEIQEIPAGTTNIQTFAANSAAGFGGDGGLATNAQLAFPVDAVADKNGNIFIADTGAVREVVAATGAIQSIAGKGVSGITSLSGDNGPATNATTIPNGLAVDAAGNIYIADGFHEVREISAATGTIQSVAGNGTPGFSGDGGPATAAQLNSPNGVFVDPAGNIFIADSFNNVIREVVGGPGGNIVTVAGNGTLGFSGDGGIATNAELAFPSGVYVDRSGNIFIADGNNCIREVLAGSNIIQTVAGNGLDGFNGDNIPATAATLNGTSSVFGDALGNIYVPDPIYNIVRSFTVGGNIHIVVGNRAQGFGGDGGAPSNAELDAPTAVFVAPSGSLVITDTFNDRIRVVASATSGQATTTMLNSSLNPSVGGQSVTFTAAVTSPAGGTLTGTVTFLDNGTQIGTGALNNGQATFNTSALTVGSHAVSAEYSGNFSFAPSSSASLTQTVNVAGFGPPPATMPTVTAGQSVTFALTMFAASGSNLSFTMTCAGLPANSSCAFSPNPFAPGPPPNGSQVQVTFSTRAASFSVPLSRQGKPGPLPIDLLGFGGLVAAIAGLFAKRSNKPNRRLGWVTIAAVTVLAVAIVGCGGGGGPSPTVTPSGGTPKGISNITVTATSASTTMTKTIAVNVQ